MNEQDARQAASRERYLLPLLCSVAGLMAGLLVTVVWLKLDSWGDAKPILSLFIGSGFVIGGLIVRKFGPRERSKGSPD